MRRDRYSVKPARNRGFTLFEMVVVICLIVILYMVAEQRLNDLPAAAERASFLGVLAQLKTALNVQMVSRMTAGNGSGVREMEGSNPMNYLLEMPKNYRGEVDSLNNNGLLKSSWYFDRSNGELVYVVGEASVDDVSVSVAGIPVNLGMIQLKIINVFVQPGERLESLQDLNLSSGSYKSGKNWQGLMLLPVYPYEWEKRPEQPVDV